MKIRSDFVSNSSSSSFIFFTKTEKLDYQSILKCVENIFGKRVNNPDFQSGDGYASYPGVQYITYHNIAANIDGHICKWDDKKWVVGKKQVSELIKGIKWWIATHEQDVVETSGWVKKFREGDKFDSQEAKDEAVKTEKEYLKAHKKDLNNMKKALAFLETNKDKINKEYKVFLVEYGDNDGDHDIVGRMLHNEVISHGFIKKGDCVLIVLSNH